MRQSPFKRKPPKAKKCRFCKEQFQPYNSSQVCCGPNCALSYARQKQANDAQKAIKAREKQLRADIKRRKDSAKTRAQWMKEAQQAINQYVRLRDRGKPCISCDKPDDGSHQRHASHYRSVGACSALRFDLRNIYASCAQCNTMKSGNLLEYRIRLRARYGDELVEWLESQNGATRYSIEYLARLKKVFSKRVRQKKKRYNMD